MDSRTKLHWPVIFDARCWRGMGHGGSHVFPVLYTRTETCFRILCIKPHSEWALVSNKRYQLLLPSFYYIHVQDIQASFSILIYNPNIWLMIQTLRSQIVVAEIRFLCRGVVSNLCDGGKISIKLQLVRIRKSLLIWLRNVVWMPPPPPSLCSVYGFMPRV